MQENIEKMYNDFLKLSIDVVSFRKERVQEIYSNALIVANGILEIFKFYDSVKVNYLSFVEIRKGDTGGVNLYLHSSDDKLLTEPYAEVQPVINRIRLLTFDKEMLVIINKIFSNIKEFSVLVSNSDEHLGIFFNTVEVSDIL